MVATKTHEAPVGVGGHRVRRRFVASTIRLVPFALAALATALAVILAIGWRADHQVVALRVDMLRRERALTGVVLAEAGRAVAEAGRGSEETLAHVDLLVISWATLSDGGPELGLDLELTDRVVPPLPDLDTRFADVSGRLTAYRTAVIETLAEGAETDRLPALRAQAAGLVDRFATVLRDVGDETPPDSRLLWAAASLAFAAACGCAGVAANLVRARRRTARPEESVENARPVVPKRRCIVGEARRRGRRSHGRMPQDQFTRRSDRRGCPRRSRPVRPDSAAP